MQKSRAEGSTVLVVVVVVVVVVVRKLWEVSHLYSNCFLS